MDINLMTYNDIVISIEIAGDNLEAAKLCRDHYRDEMTCLAPHDISSANLDGMPHGNKSPHTLDYCYEQVQKYEESIRLTEDFLIKLKVRKEEIEKNMGRLEGLEQKVARMKYVERKSLKEIASELGYSEGYIKNISAQLNM